MEECCSCGWVSSWASASLATVTGLDSLFLAPNKHSIEIQVISLLVRFTFHWMSCWLKITTVGKSMGSISIGQWLCMCSPYSMGVNRSRALLISTDVYWDPVISDFLIWSRSKHRDSYCSTLVCWMVEVAPVVCSCKDILATYVG